MRCVIQRIKKGNIQVDSNEIARTCSGLAVFLGVEVGDNEKDLLLMAKKISGIRIFEDDTGRMMNAMTDTQEILLISQFTLMGRLESGFRPDFTRAEKPELANQMIEKLVTILRTDYKRNVKTGQFGADMEVNLCVDGPVTILFDTRS
jgi:D-tyrosyl-tRNA(Tyr) deacylase